MLPPNTIKMLIEKFLNDEGKDDKETLFKKGVDGESLEDLKYAKIYNEFSLQHELGIFLRDELKKIDTDFNVQFERNVKDFYSDIYYEDRLLKDDDFVKHEMDIVVFKNFEKDSEKYAIELKFPTNGAYPKRMYQFVEDIQFMEENRCKLKFKKTYCLALIFDKAEGFLFREWGRISRKNTDNTIDPIYQFFRGKSKPDLGPRDFSNKHKTDKTTHEPQKLNVIGSYPIEWIPIGATGYHYYLIEIPDDSKIKTII